MRTGVLTMNTDEGIHPVELAREVEDLGIESVFVPDHSHIPVRRSAAYGGPRGIFPDSPGDMPREYYRNYEQLVTMAAMGAATTTLKVGTGVCLPLQRDPIYLAKEVASVDHMTGGRLLFGIGGGAPWNAEEMAAHGTDPRTRFTLMLERLTAMKKIWTQDEAEHHGRFVDFDPLFSWPKPVHKPYPPILLGGNGPTTLPRVVEHCDGWMPGHLDENFDELPDRIAELQELAAAAGRGRIEVTLYLGRLDRVDDYVELDVDRVVYVLPTTPHDDVRATLRRVAHVAEQTA